MSKSVSRARASVLALMALASLAACGDSPMTPDPVGAAQESTAAMFAQILDKLESIEERIDSLEATVDATGGGELVLTGLPAAQLDSIIELASFIAEEASTGGWELCGALELAGKGGLEFGGGAEGRAAGDVGAWAGTGAHAGAKAKAAFELKGGIELALGGQVEGCIPLGGGDPPVRPSPAGPARAAQMADLQTTLGGLATQLGLDESSVTQSLGGLGNAFQSPGSLTMLNATSYLPMPAAFASMASNPLGTAMGRLSDLQTTAQGALCGGTSWGTGLSSIIQQACGVIGQGGLPSITILADLSTSFPAMQTAVGNVCNRVNNFGQQRLTIASWDITILGSTYRVFPGYNSPLFPNYTSVTCP